MTAPVSANKGLRFEQSKNYKKEKKATSNLDLILEEILEKQPGRPYQAPASASLNPSILTNQIMEASPKRIIRLIRENPNVNFINMTSAIQRVANEIISADEVSEDLEESWEELEKRLFSMLKNSFEPIQHRSLCNISYSIAKKIEHSKVGLSENGVKLLRLIINKLVYKFKHSGHKFEEQNLSNVLTAFHIINNQVKGLFNEEFSANDFFKLVSQEVLKREVEDYSSKSQALTAFSFSKLEDDFGVVGKFAEIISKKSSLRNFYPEELTTLAHAFFKKNGPFQNKALKNIAREIDLRSQKHPGLKDFDHSSLANIAHIFSNIRENYHEILENIAYEISLRAKSRYGLEDFSPQSLNCLAMAFSNMGVNYYRILENIAYEIGLRAESRYGLEEFNDLELSDLAYSYARLRKNYHRILENIACEVSKKSKAGELKKFRHKSLVELIVAFGLFEEECSKINNYGLFDLIESEIKDRREIGRLENFSIKSLNTLACAFAKIKTDDSEIIRIIKTEIQKKLETHFSDPQVIAKAVLDFSISKDNYSLILDNLFNIIKNRYEANRLSDFEIRDLALLAKGSTQRKIDSKVFEWIAEALKNKINNEGFGIDNIIDFISLANSFAYVGNNLEVFKHVANFIRAEKVRNNLIHFRPEELAGLARAFAMTGNDHGLFEDVAFAVREQKANGYLADFSTGELVDLAKAFCNMKKDYGLFEDIAFAVRKQRERGALINFWPKELAGLARAFAMTGNDHGLFEDVAFAVREQKANGYLADFRPKDLVTLAWTFSCSRKDYGLFEDVAFAVRRRREKNGLAKFKPENLADLAKAFCNMKKDHGLFEDVAFAVRRRREKNDLAKFSSKGLVELARAFSFLDNNYGLFEDIAIAIRKQRERGTLVEFNSKELARLARIFSFLDNKYGLFEDIAFAVKQKRQKNNMVDFSFGDLERLAKACSISGNNYGLFEDIAFAVKQKTLKNDRVNSNLTELLSIATSFFFSGVDYDLFQNLASIVRQQIKQKKAFTSDELSQLTQVFVTTENANLIISDLCSEINKKILESGVNDFRTEDLANLSLNLSFYNKEIAFKFIEEFFERESSSKDLIKVLYATVILIKTNKIKETEIPLSWINKFKEIEHLPPNPSVLEESVGRTLMDLGVKSFSKNQYVSFNINGYLIDLFEVDFIDGKKIIEVDGPTHLDIWDDRKSFILKAMGYSVARIKWYQWDPLSPSEKREFLKDKMRNSFSSVN